MNSPLTKITATEAVVESLKNRIQEGEFRPGEKMPSEQALHHQIRAVLVQYAQSVPDWKQALERHTPILDAIIAGDRERARFLAWAHAGICASFIHQYKDVPG